MHMNKLCQKVVEKKDRALRSLVKLEIREASLGCSDGVEGAACQRGLAGGIGVIAGLSHKSAIDIELEVIAAGAHDQCIFPIQRRNSRTERGSDKRVVASVLSCIVAKEEELPLIVDLEIVKLLPFEAHQDPYVIACMQRSIHLHDHVIHRKRERAGL